MEAAAELGASVGRDGTVGDGCRVPSKPAKGQKASVACGGFPEGFLLRQMAISMSMESWLCDALCFDTPNT